MTTSFSLEMSQSNLCGPAHQEQNFHLLLPPYNVLYTSTQPTSVPTITTLLELRRTPIQGIPNRRHGPLGSQTDQAGFSQQTARVVHAVGVPTPLLACDRVDRVQRSAAKQGRRRRFCFDATSSSSPIHLVPLDSKKPNNMTVAALIPASRSSEIDSLISSVDRYNPSSAFRRLRLSRPHRTR